MSEKIVVTSPTGYIGRHLVKRLAESGKVSVCAAAYNIDKARILFGSLGNKVELVQTRFEDPQSFKHVLTGASRLFLLTPSVIGARQSRLEGELTQLAVNSGVRQIVKVSALGASIDEPTSSLLRWQARAEREVLKIDPSRVVILRPNFLLHNLFKFDTIATECKLYACSGDKKVAPIDGRDIADVAFSIFTSPVEQHNTLTYNLTGPTPMTIRGMADMLSQHSGGKRIEYVDLSDADFFDFLRTTCKMNDMQSHAFLKLHQFFKMEKESSCVFGDSQIVMRKAPRRPEQFFQDFAKELMVPMQQRQPKIV